MNIQTFTCSHKNFIANCFLPLSAIAFFQLHNTATLEYNIGMVIAVLIISVFSAHISPLKKTIKDIPLIYRIFSILTAGGICLAGLDTYSHNPNQTLYHITINSTAPITVNVSGFFGLFLAILASYFIYCCILYLGKNIFRLIRETGLFQEINSIEWGIYLLLCFISITLVTVCFSKSCAFYTGPTLYDIIYTSDSTSLVADNCYMNLTHPENDLRQPLFAVFSAPFVGLPYLLGKLFRASVPVQAMLLNSVQIILLYLANLMLVKLMRLSRMKRICFMMLASCTYTHLLFTLMMEQYIFAYFWLIFCIFLICEYKNTAPLALWGAAGTLLPSVVLLPFLSKNNPKKSLRMWFQDTVTYGIGFLLLLLLFCRFDVIFNLTKKVSDLSNFTGKTVSFADRVYQYMQFIPNCFVAPNTEQTLSSFGYISWQLTPITTFNYIGAAIFTLAIVSALLNRKQASSRLAGIWVCFSALVLLIFGWGTKENGLILYSLYFGWAFLVLLFQLIERIGALLNTHFLLPLLSIGSPVALITVNLPAIHNLVVFAITNYPT